MSKVVKIGQVYRHKDNGKKMLVRGPRGMMRAHGTKWEKVAEYPHGDGDFSYKCGNRRCICASGMVSYLSSPQTRKTERKNLDNMSQDERREIAKKTGDRCAYCGDAPLEKDWTIDHILPLALGGLTVYTNLVLACEFCNQEKGDKLLSDFRESRGGSLWFDEQKINIY